MLVCPSWIGASAVSLFFGIFSVEVDSLGVFGVWLGVFSRRWAELVVMLGGWPAILGCFWGKSGLFSPTSSRNITCVILGKVSKNTGVIPPLGCILGAFWLYLIMFWLIYYIQNG